jgi:Ni,Fe-hydrogenase III large subunit
LRALALELERLANHLGDVGAIGNDAGFAFGLAQFSRLKEQLLRATEQALGQRYLMDFVVPGGTRIDLSSAGNRLLIESIESIAAEVDPLRTILMNTRDCATGLWGPVSSHRPSPPNWV